MNDAIQNVLDLGAAFATAKTKAEASVKEVISATKRRDRLVREAADAEKKLNDAKAALGQTPAKK